MSKSINIFTTQIVKNLENQNWFMMTALVIVVLAIITYFLNKINNSFNNKSTVGSKFFKSIWIPILFLIWTESLYIIIRTGFSQLHFINKKISDNIPYTIFVAFIGFLLFSLLSQLATLSRYTKKINGTFGENSMPLQLVFRLIKICILLITSFIILQNIGINILAFIFFSSYYVAIIGGLFILNSIIRILHYKIISAVVKKGNFWIYILVKSIYSPLQYLLILSGIYICYKIAFIRWDYLKGFSSIIFKFYSLFSLGLLSWFLIRFVKLFEEQLILGRLTKKGPSKTTSQAIGKLTKAAVIIIILLLSLPIIGIPISGILAFGGASAVIVGIAIKPISENYFGGLLIYSDRFFEVGDWIYSPDQNIEGTIENIGWRSTRIRTFEKRPLYVPNSVFSKISVINASRMTNRRIKETIGVRYEDASILNKITSDIKSMLEEHPGIDSNQTLLVHFTEFGPYSLNINVYTFTKTKNWEEYRDVQQDVFLKIIKIVEDNNAMITMPMQKILLDKGH